jgi:hypothetical protein
MQLNKPLTTFTWKNWALVLFLTLLLFFIFLFSNNRDYIFSGEEQILTKIDVGKDMIFTPHYKPPYNFVFINVSKDLELVKDENGGDIPITDREKLATFFKILADRDQHTYLLSDIFFDLPSEHDSALAGEIKRLKRAIFPKHLSDTAVLPSVIPVPSAVADYNTNIKQFSKFRLLYRDSFKTIPVAIHEALQGVKYTHSFWGLFCNNNYCLQTIPPRYYIRPYQLMVSKAYPYFNLGDLLILSNDSSFYDQFLKNKFIVLGNYETDMHFTPIGKMQGVLILLNTYLSLLNGKQQPGGWWFLTIFLFFFLINLYLFFGKVHVPKVTDYEKWWHVFLQEQLNSQLAKIFSVVGLCLGITVISELIFNIKPNTFIIFIYIIACQGLIKYYKLWAAESK